MTRSRWLLVGLAGTLACAGAPPAPQLPAPSGPPVLASGDSLQVLVWRSPELSGAFRVTADGALGHPLYRTIPVAGRPLDDIRRSIEDYLRTLQQNPQVTLDPRFAVAVTGEVRVPGLYWVPPEATIAQAIARAGGATERARMDRVEVRRDGARHEVDLTAPGIEPARMAVRSTDQISVPRRGGSPLLALGVLATVTSIVASIVVIAGS